MSHLLLFSLGPVQDFIATARRCQDLWFGSWLLSDLSSAAAQAISGITGADSLIVPGKLTSDASVANEIYVQCADLQTATQAAEAAKTAVAERLEGHLRLHFAKVPDEGFHRVVAEAQVRALIETAWVTVPTAVGDYTAARRRAKSLLAARKATKNFGVVEWSEVTKDGVPKSSLDGSRESVIDESIYDQVRRDPKRADWLMKHYRARPAERLSGVDLLKRLGQEVNDEEFKKGRPSFHSTSHISSGPMRTRVARLGQEGQEALSDWLSFLQNEGISLDRFAVNAGRQSAAHFSHRLTSYPVPRVLSHGPNPSRGLDGYLLYEDRLLDIFEQYSEGAVSPQRVEAARLKLKSVLKRLGWTRPVQPYYAFLLADGDRMGVAIDGLKTTKDHARLSEELEKWAASCREIVEDELGSCIYAGGDDVMAVVPLHRALPCARRLAEAFAIAIESAVPKLTPEARPSEAPTLSVGLAIVHHMVPMRDALALVREAEKDAKTIRNALAIKVAKRSGGTLTVIGSWSEPTPIDERIGLWCDHFSGELLPDKAAFAMEEAVSLLIDSPGPDKGPRLEPAAIRALAQRALMRRRGERGGRELDVETAKLLKARFELKDIPPKAAVQSLSAELQIARLFLDADEEAWGPRNTENLNRDEPNIGAPA